MYTYKYLLQEIVKIREIKDFLVMVQNDDITCNAMIIKHIQDIKHVLNICNE